MCKDTCCRCDCGREEITVKEECQFFRKNAILLSEGFSDKSKPYLRNFEKCQKISRKLVDTQAGICTRCSNLPQAPIQIKGNEMRGCDNKDSIVKGTSRERIEPDQQSSDEGSPGGVLLPSPTEMCSAAESPEGGVSLPPGWDLKIERNLEEDCGDLTPIAEGSGTNSDPKDLIGIEQI